MCIYISVYLFIYRSMYRYASVYGNPLQYSCLENFMDRGAGQPTFHWVSMGYNWACTLFIQHIDIWASMCMHMQLCGIRHTCLCVQDTYVHLCAYLCMMDGHKGVCIYISQQCILDFPDGSRVKKLLVNAGDMSSILDLGRSTKPDQLSPEQLSQDITSTGSVCCNYWSPWALEPVLAAREAAAMRSHRSEKPACCSYRKAGVPGRPSTAKTK